MAHRGRLNVLANVARTPLFEIISLFQDIEPPEDYGAGDVKYHLGTTGTFFSKTANKKVRVTVVANASHLEAVNPIVLGRVKAELVHTKDKKKVLPILIHGDASFSGQGICFETIHLAKVPHYKVYGTVHIIFNNQIGFTTDPRFHRSSAYCTDVAKVSNSPIIHVNGDNVEAVLQASKLLTECRMNFLDHDVVLDIIGYRRHGHNEADEPMFTQPLMYTKIKASPTILEKYYRECLKNDLTTKEEQLKYEEDFLKMLEAEYEKGKAQTEIHPENWVEINWPTFGVPTNGEPPKTGISADVINHIGTVFASRPTESNFDFHIGITNILNKRVKLLEDKSVDWALAEAIAIGSLLKENIHVRLSGQDAQRGVFDQRHHVLHHQTKDKVTYEPLNHLYPSQALYTVCNSPTGQNGVLGFELGYSTYSPNALVMWEAQFGDFVNNAQVIIDQFISGGQEKWVRQSGIVLLLPHGMEGQGSEYSNARPERFLLGCNDEPNVFPEMNAFFEMNQLKKCNWIVANCSTPANYFHILRRQIKLEFRKPLILFTPKSLLKHPACKSSFEEMTENTQFQRVIPDFNPNQDKISKLLFCSGRVYYDIMEERGKKKLNDDIAICRIEQLSPFPFDLVKAEYLKYKNLKSVCWLQEEHKNSGPWIYVRPRFAAIGLKNIEYIGRRTSSAAATGFRPKHIRELEEMMRNAIMI
ncbi:2-oxoglutarate dehydrogenase, mitochondrial-like [Chrysoperla carnea]|uniref:2-oxoglutarate dehydrogenase, mitochondrial-like n=1 Tax=Chrysoperla carnea TaxID=189513 RepID=UPI001D078541|nr:2-oxoglutarate dehydrogenase, mitochondrial-like [Chrysoperla carnea]